MASTGPAFTTAQFASRNTGWPLPNPQVIDERQKISRDIHDSAVQPYIGLKLALEALARKIPPEHPLSRDVGKPWK